LACFLVFAALLLRLAQITVVLGDYYYEISHERKTVYMELRGTRGEIFDRYGLPLAQNRQIFSVQLDRRKMPLGHTRINQMILNFLDVLESSGEMDSLILNLPIGIDESGNPYYAWRDKDEETQVWRFDRWRKNASIDQPLPAVEMLKHLRERYEIDESIPDDLALKIISIRLDVFLNRFSTNPVRVAADLSHSAISKLEIRSDLLPGINVFVETARLYPLGEVASHVLGHVGRIDEEKVEDYTEKGYNPAIDSIGKRGIEAYAENRLTAGITERHGEMMAEVDSRGRVIRVISKTPAQDGNDVILTIDRALQKAVEDILEREIKDMSSPEPPPPYNQADGERKAPLARQGAAVVMDVNTGELLALASYPSFDPNWYVHGISQENYDTILEMRALTAMAFQERYAPGSTFKMLIGIAGLMEGKITLDEKIVCRDEFIRHGWSESVAPECWAYYGHGPLDLESALEVSCNYFFYEVADRLGIDAINKWADIFGVNGYTGITEIGDVETFAGGPHNKELVHRSSIETSIRRLMNQYIPEFRETDEDIQEKHVKRLADLPHTTLSREIREIIRDEMGFLDTREDSDALANVSDKIRFDVLRHYKRWLAMDTVMTGTGQAYVRLTPLSAARLTASLANGGKVLKPRLVRGIVSENGEIEYTQPEVLNEAMVDEQYMQAIKQGMLKAVFDVTPRVGHSGTAVRTFAGMDENITLGGKTGTAQTVAGVEERNTAWFMSFTPFDNPQIAVVVMIPNGRSSSNAAYVARKIIEEYYRLSEQRRLFESIGNQNEITPN
jgi:penicillin-binding protein 2